MPASQALKLETNVAVPMRDGTILYADIYRPEAPGPYPILLQRTPYDKTMPSRCTCWIRSKPPSVAMPR